ncbi:hypothetical protein EMEDMD4_70152 [Sinorhizobium medicae]|uniref:Uncharacterized protein n=1 Tax=Sinorhizobium medicae TaxID=110321 RepID=A0A508X513_9HYPH|nr:hypothetical protein EMEDMD4_70152 [Sinorhizobium medicae]
MQEDVVVISESARFSAAVEVNALQAGCESVRASPETVGGAGIFISRPPFLRRHRLARGQQKSRGCEAEQSCRHRPHIYLLIGTHLRGQRSAAFRCMAGMMTQRMR